MLDYEYVTSAERLGHIANEIHRAGVIALDLETTPKEEWRDFEGAAFSPHLGRIRLCSINTGKQSYVIDLFKTGTLGPVRDALHNPNEETGAGRPIVVGQNIKFDQIYLLAHEGIELWPIFDTFRASAVIHNGRNLGHNLYDLYARELKIGPQAPDHGGSDWGLNELSREQLDYAAEDVIWLPSLRDKLRPQLEKHGLLFTAFLEFGAILPEAWVEINGFPINPKKWLALAAENKIKRNAAGAELLKILPNPRGQMMLPGAADWMFGPDVIDQWVQQQQDDEDSEEEAIPSSVLAKQFARTLKRGKKDKSQFNLDSSAQLLESLRRLGGRLAKLENTNEMNLAMYSSEFSAIAKLLDYREFATKVKSFGPDYLEWINPVTKRIHPGYFPLLAAGRYACSKPNLAQIPRDKAFRKCFEAPEGWKMVVCDFSGIEMRLAAEISGDPTLMRVFQKGIDPHRYTASIITKKPAEAVTKEERQQAKPANFGFLYGMQAEKFVLYAMKNYGVKLTLDQSREFRTAYFNEFSGLRTWHERTLYAGKRDGISRTIRGRLRYLDPNKAHNEFLNTPVQGSGADGLKAALRRVYFRLRKVGTDKVRMVHHVHDEIVTLTRDDRDEPELVEHVKHELSAGMKEGMEQIMTKVPVEAEASAGSSWADK